jgi:hypothetical protein
VQNTTVLNRDVNACRNFTTIFLSIIAGRGRPPRFSPGAAAAPAAPNPIAGPKPNPNGDQVDPNVEENVVAIEINDAHQ